MKRPFVFVVPLVCCVMGAPAMSMAGTRSGGGQPTAPTVAQVSSDSTAQDETPPTEEHGIYSYDPAGRRDPFVSLLGRGGSIGPVNDRPPGLAGLSVNELSLQGLVFANGRHLAVMQAPDRKTYILYGNEQLFDALVKDVTPEGVTFVQAVNDPLSLVKEREVVRTLQSREDGR